MRWKLTIHLPLVDEVTAYHSFLCNNISSSRLIFFLGQDLAAEVSLLLENRSAVAGVTLSLNNKPLEMRGSGSHPAASYCINNLNKL